VEKAPDGSSESTGSAGNSPSSLPVRPPGGPRPPKPPKPILAPISSATYKQMLDAATQAGHGAAFREMCMVLKAPPSLNSIFLVLKNIRYMLTVLPDEWVIGDCFVGWAKMAAWALDNQEALAKLYPSNPKTTSRQKTSDENPPSVDSITGFGLVEYPIYATLCCHHELSKHQANYARLQAHLLIARHRQLGAHHDQSYVDLYETHTKSGDFAKKMRQPGTVAQEIRKMRADKYGPMLTFMKPELDQDCFGPYLRSFTEYPSSVIARQFLLNIGFYCSFETSARPGGKRTRRDHTTGVRSAGFIQYNDTRTGTNYWNDDPDDEGLRLSQQEFIRDHAVDRHAADAEHLHPNELGEGDCFIGQGDSHETGTTPGKLASIRSAVHRIEIDTDRMAWSATHLRPDEIAGTLLSHLASIAAAPGETVDDEELENCALIAVSLETARPLAAAMEIRSGRTGGGDFLFVPSRRKGGASQWRWSAIEPYYAKEIGHVAGTEVFRTDYLDYPVHPVADTLLCTWTERHHKNSPKSRQLFEKPIEEYRKRIRIWLRKLDSTGRLTASKIADLKWILLCQETGSDIAEASLTLGQHQRMAGVPLFYSLLSVSDATELFQKATARLWSSPRDDGPANSAKASNEEEDEEIIYTGSRICPNLMTVKHAIRITRRSANRLAHLDFAAPLPKTFVKMFNRAVLFLVWHQSYAIAARGIRMPYIPLSKICESSGVTTFADKDTGTGYKTRLLWLTPALIDHMRQTEPLIDRVQNLLQIKWKGEIPPIFFLNGDLHAVVVRPKTIEYHSRKFFPFPSNTPRHFMRFELRKHLSSEEVEMFMGHSIERREPWCKWSSLDYGIYLDKLRVCIPKILAELGLERRLSRESAGH